jgi:CheY-like chemotaxis protein
MPTGGGGSDDDEVGAELDGGLPSAEVDGIPGGGEVTGVEPLIYPDGVERSHLRVLCAEDHLFERTAIAHLFKSTNEQYRASNLPLQLAVQLVPSMDGVMQAIAEAPPDEAFHIILLDVNLDRGRTSEEIIGWIREKVGEKVPIVLFSATAHMDTVRAAATRAAGPARGPRPRARAHAHAQ